MKVAAVSLALTGIFAIVSAQGGLGGMPKCAQDCALGAIPEECGIDVKCICEADAFLNAITCCVAENCSPEDQKKTIDFAKGICATAQVTNIPDSAICKSGAAPTGTESTAVSSSASVSSTQAAATTTSGTAATQTSSSPTTEESGSAETSGGAPSETSNAAVPISQNANGAIAALAAVALALV
ncbi:hypothetical protein AJ80_05765 [Polytolypa hystricis UAMH7299]|uniref:CFEM domain-containing protein n=1 Tax=Polytolypa hystricis (strain UAMH7299) TaxID=1447883 RepID=A0A2B7Y0Z6_POLH7|nr:hypothetical protein AJ80_05765 [Polytolypa hystricis UAMH7299]